MFSLSERDIKTILQIEETEYDDYIEKMLPLTISFVENYCNNTFAERDEDGKLVKTKKGYNINKEAIVIPIALLIEYFMNESGVTMQTISRVTTMYTTNLPNSITSQLNMFRKVKFV